MSDEFINVADITDIDINQSQYVQLDGIDILICHTTKGVFAVEDKCSHADIPLCGGQIIDNFINLDQDSFALCPSCPIDVALMEKTQEAHVMPFNASWSDIGNWMSYLKTQEKEL